MGRRIGWILAALVLLVALIGTGLVEAQDKTYYWQRFDVDLTVLSNGDLRVVETQEFVFTSGTFRRVYANIPLDKIEGITNVRVTGDGRPYTEGTGPYSYSTSIDRERNEFLIEITFPAVSNSTNVFVIEYTAVGALRVYPDGDQVWWKAVSAERDFPVVSSTVTVNLPAGTDGDIKATSYGVPASQEILPDGQTVIYRADNIPPGQELEVRVQFPHGLVEAQAGAWQAAADREAAWNETWRPVANLAAGALSLLLLVAGSLGVYLLWYSRGRDKPVGLVADIAAEPPDELPPGVVGTLLDESADMRDVIASIIDLARRGVIKMTEVNEPGFLGIGSRRDFVFERLQDNPSLRPYERTLVDSLFHSKQAVRLSSLKEKFYVVLPALYDQLYDEVVRAGFFRRSPSQTRQIYSGLGCAVGVLSVILGIMAFIFALTLVEAALCLPAAMLVVSVVLMAAGRYMPSRTLEGATATAKWRAFKRYLENIEKYQKLEESKDIFEKYLPYAIAFGLEQEWVNKFAAVEAPAPEWYESMPPVVIFDSGHPRPPRPYRPSPQTPRPAGPQGGSGGQVPQVPDLQGGSDSMARGLQSMSGSLASMLTIAGSILASAPSSSRGGGGFGGGGGWSGGGGFGGGGGGGGGRGAG